MMYFTGFVIEKTLAMDNIFVIAMIFSFMAIPRLYQHRVLFWGIIGVIHSSRDYDWCWGGVGC
jgi:tellurite resistance protein TerC